MDNNEERYVATPKGLAWLALNNVGMLDNVTEGQFEAFWILFEEYMRKAEYIVEE
jgi:hypothetical protein